MSIKFHYSNAMYHLHYLLIMQAVQCVLIIIIRITSSNCLILAGNFPGKRVSDASVISWLLKLFVNLLGELVGTYERY